MTFEHFSDGTSFLHRADPKGKLISTGVLTLIIALGQTWGPALLGFLLAFLLVLAARLSWTKLFRRLLIVNSFNLLFCLILPLTYTGGKTFLFLGINLSSTGFFSRSSDHR